MPRDEILLPDQVEESLAATTMRSKLGWREIPRHCGAEIYSAKRRVIAVTAPLVGFAMNAGIGKSPRSAMNWRGLSFEQRQPQEHRRRGRYLQHFHEGHSKRATGDVLKAVEI